MKIIEVEASTVTTGVKKLFLIRYINTGASLIPLNFSIIPGMVSDFQPGATFVKVDWLSRLITGYTHKITCIDIEAFVKLD
jgi:hypothetical protein